jgi:hypothetical protein
MNPKTISVAASVLIGSVGVLASVTAAGGSQPEPVCHDQAVDEDCLAPPTGTVHGGPTAQPSLAPALEANAAAAAAAAAHRERLIAAEVASLMRRSDRSDTTAPSQRRPFLLQIRDRIGVAVHRAHRPASTPPPDTAATNALPANSNSSAQGQQVVTAPQKVRQTRHAW